MTVARRVLVCEPWWRGSHRAWAEGWAQHTRHDLDVVGVRAGSWRWRLRAGAVPVAAALADRLDRLDRDPPDAVVVSGAVDVAQLLGLARRRLPADVPVAVMQHESQLVHPTPDGRLDDEAALRNWLSWRAADAVWWNSAFHRDAVLAALPGWLRSIPADDRGGDPDRLVADLAARSEVVHVGIDPPAAGPGAVPRSGPPIVLWPHRWEWDKDPDAFVRALGRLADDGHDFRVVLAGDEPTVGTSARADVAAELGRRVAAVGPFEREAYEAWLAVADVVVSCARHEFFGVGVAEAIVHGAWPVVPDDLAYREVVPDCAPRYRRGTFGSALRSALTEPPSLDDRRTVAATVAERFGWPTVAARLDAAVDRLVRGDVD